MPDDICQWHKGAMDTTCPFCKGERLEVLIEDEESERFTQAQRMALQRCMRSGERYLDALIYTVWFSNVGEWLYDESDRLALAQLLTDWHAYDKAMRKAGLR